MKWPGEGCEAPEADVTNLRLINLPDSLQGIKDLTTSPVTTLVVSTEAKTHDGAKLTREVFFNLRKYSSLVPGNGARKLAATR
jgi:hypothetical protein